MADFATAEELASYVQSDLDRSTAELNLAIVSASIRTACGWSISEEVSATFVLNGTGRPTLFMPTLRLTAVTSVTELGVTVDPTLYEWTDSGILRRLLYGIWTSAARGVTVIATHGYATVPAEIKGACLEHAARLMSSPEGGTRGYTVGNMSETFGGTSTLVSALADDPRITPYRIPALA